ncbi:MAG TPA: HigA family addiction module antitoxin [Candidatus Binataceae bacterium]|nr:HigA family addiction module antitoxin [Candidatus Binataceae bacterium]
MKRHEEYPVNREAVLNRKPTHPGDWFTEDILPHLGRRTISEMATLMGISRQHLHGVMSGERSITADMAVRLGKLCGNGAEIWLGLQARYDAWEARRRLAKELKKIPSLSD